MTTPDACTETRRASGFSDTCIAAKHDGHPTVLQHKRPRGGGRTRNADNADNAGDVHEQLARFQASPTYLRLPASSVAALCGLHPFQNLPQLLCDYVYQSPLGQALLQRDATALGLTLVPPATRTCAAWQRPPCACCFY